MGEINEVLSRIRLNDPTLTDVSNLYYEYFTSRTSEDGSVTRIRQVANIDQGHVKELFQGLKFNTHVTTLDLSGHGLTLDRVASDQLFNCISRKSNITTFIFDNNRFGLAALEAINKGLQARKANPVNILSIRNNRLNRHGLHALIKDNMLAQSGLRALDLSGNRLGDRSAQYLAASLAEDGVQLQNLIISNNHIKSTGGRAIADALSNSTLLALDISQNCLGTNVVRHFAITIPNTSIRAVNLKDTSVSHAIKEFADLIEAGSTLQTLLLSWSALGNDEPARLLQAFRTSPTILRVNMNWWAIPLSRRRRQLLSNFHELNLEREQQAATQNSFHSTT